MQGCSLHIVDFGIQKVPIPGFSTKTLFLQLYSYTLSLTPQKNCVKRGMPVTKSRNIFLLFQVPAQYSHSFQTIKSFIIVVLNFFLQTNPSRNNYRKWQLEYLKSMNPCYLQQNNSLLMQSSPHT